MKKLITTLLALTAVFGINEIAKADTTTATAAAQVSSADDVASKLLDHFYNDLITNNVSDLKSILAQNFYIQRETGEYYNYEQYLSKFAKIKTNKITNIKSSSDGVVLVVRFDDQNTGLINTKAFSGKSTPRLATFENINGTWLMTSFANFDQGIKARK